MKPTDPDKSDSRTRVLIVEDDAVARQGLVQLLEPRGFHTAVAGTLKDGLERLAWRPDYMLLDLSLSDGRGTVLLRRVRANRLPIRVAVTTGTVDECLVAAALILRPDRLFRKPYSTVDLMNWLQPRDGSQGDQTARPPTGCPPPVAHPPLPYNVNP